MIPQEKIELAELLEEKMFSGEQGIKLEQVRRIIGGVEHEILLVKLKLLLLHSRMKSPPLPGRLGNDWF